MEDFQERGGGVSVMKDWVEEQVKEIIWTGLILVIGNFLFNHVFTFV